jgi:hypothetical protein
MAKKKSPPAPKPQPEPEVIPPQEVVDLGGMSPEQFHQAVLTGVEEALGQAPIEMVGAVLDQSLEEYLNVVDQVLGPNESREAALRFGRTIIPYCMRGVTEAGQTYGQLRGKK